MSPAEDRPDPTVAARRRDRPATPQPRAAVTDPNRAESLGRIAAEVSGRRDLTGLFHDIIDEAFKLFGVDRAGLWTYDDTKDVPLELAAQRGLPAVIVDAVTSLPRDARTAAWTPLRTRRVRVLDRAMRQTTRTLREVYRAIGVGSICFVPLVFGDEALGAARPVPPRAVRLDAGASGPWPARSATRWPRPSAARGSAESRRTSPHACVDRGPRRPAQRHRRPGGIGEAIVAEAKRLDRARHDPRLPRRPRDRLVRADRVRGHLPRHAPSRTPRRSASRSAKGSPAGSRSTASRPSRQRRRPTRASCSLGDRDRPESMLVVPMVYEDQVRRRHRRVARSARDRFDEDDEIDAVDLRGGGRPGVRQRRQRSSGSAASSTSSSTSSTSQRRLLEVNERLLSTLDPAGVLDLIADSLKTDRARTTR